MPRNAEGTTARRVPLLDAVRGVAMLWMAGFHLCFDLVYFGWFKANVYNDPAWTWNRTCILSLFLMTAGASQVLAQHNGGTSKQFWRRWGQIAIGAGLVSAGTWFVFPDSFIYFGVLHGMALMLLLVRGILLRAPQWGLLLLALGLLGVPMLAASAHAAWPALDMLNDRPLNWLGFISRKPITEDFVPLMPWLGVMLLGVVLGRWMVNPVPSCLSSPLPTVLRPLGWLGRHSLFFYLAHQPLLFGVLTLLVA